MIKKKEFGLDQEEKGIEYSRFKIFHPEHRGKLDSFLEGRVTSPVHVRINPTDRCDHDCFSCVYNYEWSKIHPLMSRTDEIPKEKMDKILSDFADIGVKAITYSGGGEPLVYPHIISALEQTIDYGIDFAINTNGQRLNGKRAELLSHASWIRVSANAIDDKTFADLRRKPKRLFPKLISNLRDFAKTKPKSCSLGINFVVHRENASTIYEAIKFFKELGVDVIKFTPVWGPDFFKYHKDIRIPVTEQIGRARQDFQDNSFRVYDTYEQDFRLTAFPERTYSRCYNMQIQPTIGADCGVYACHNKAYDPLGLIGSIKEQSFKSLWFSKETLEFFRNFNSKTSCNQQCTADETNIALTKFIKNRGSVDTSKILQDKLKGINFV